jgi:predicted ATPase/DNA-binding winged helix-turn-helix (wHTH) protein
VAEAVHGLAAMMGQPPPRPSLRFGEFEFTPALRRLERSGETVELSSRALDILAALTERPGEVISKRELLELAWPDTVVVEAALRFHVVALRRALRDGEGGKTIIMTVPGRGYCFVGELKSAPAAIEGGASRPRDAPRPLPACPAKVVGRDEVVDELLLQLERQRFVTVVGPGGIGKTTVALLAAHSWVARHSGAAVFVDLGDLAPDSPESVAEALCAMLEIAPQGNSATECVLGHLRTREALVVLDTCEGVIDSAARLAESLVASAPGVRVLATSREALRAEGELVYRIGTLAAPPAVELTAQEALTYPAVQLFVQRVAANHAGFELSDQQAAIVAAICRELDGIALAIELAAGRVDAFGIQQVADLLTTEFALTWPGRRTATPRQQTLNATLNWSHELLDPAERKIFRRLSVLAGVAFSLEAAIAVCGDAQTTEGEVVEALVSLVAKSLVRTAADGSRRRFHLLDIARAYARSKLDASREEADVRARQARYYREVMDRPAAATEDHTVTSESLANVRALLGWAFATEGMDVLAVELSAAAASLWLREGLPADSRRWTREALARLDRGIEVGSEPHARIALASSLMYTQGLTAESRGNSDNIDQPTPVGGRSSERRLAELAVPWGHQLRLAHFAAAQRLLDEANFLEAVNGDATVAAAFHWMPALTAHNRGDHRAAHEHAQRILDELTEGARDLMRRLFGYDLEVGALRLLSLLHFFLGDVDRALALLVWARERASSLNYVTPLAHTPPWQAFMAYQLEEAEEVDRLATPIIESERPNALQPALGTHLAIQGLSLARQGDVARGREMVLRGLSVCQEADWHMMDDFIRAELALQLARQRLPQEAQAALNLLEEQEETWSSPEIARIRGAIAELSGDLTGAEARYLDALVVAERQGALIWRLRAATSLAALWVSQGRAAEAQATLAPVYEQCCAARSWPDLRRAADCLEACRRALTVAAESPNAGLDEDHLLGGDLERPGAALGKDPPGAFSA